jgi:hypothetical protein
MINERTLIMPMPEKTTQSVSPRATSMTSQEAFWFSVRMGIWVLVGIVALAYSIVTAY